MVEDGILSMHAHNGSKCHKIHPLSGVHNGGWETLH
jgi:hypothetical protein